LGVHASAESIHEKEAKDTKAFHLSSKCSKEVFPPFLEGHHLALLPRTVLMDDKPSVARRK
jgi:hypothetical protein